MGEGDEGKSTEKEGQLSPYRVCRYRMAACERKFSEEASEWESRMRESDRVWQVKAGELEQIWGERILLFSHPSHLSYTTYPP